MRESMLFRSMLNNAESWINITKTDLNNLESPRSGTMDLKIWNDWNYRYSLCDVC